MIEIIINANMFRFLVSSDPFEEIEHLQNFVHAQVEGVWGWSWMRGGGGGLFVLSSEHLNRMSYIKRFVECVWI